MMKKIRFWVAGIIVIVSTVIIRANFVGQPVARDGRLVVKVLRSSFLEPFVIPKDLYVVKTDGTGEINEKPPHQLGDQAKWSPDGQWIVYSTLHNFWGSAETSDIYLMRSDGNFRTRVTDHQTGGSFDPAWSADGTNLAYFAYDKNGNNDGIYIANVQCLLQEEKCSPTPRFLVRGDSPNWSPNGEFIVYKPLYPEEGIYIIRTDGTGQPTTLPLPEVKICFAPQWSPDGARIATSCYQEQSNSFEIFIANLDGSEVSALAEGSMPSWSPDGSKIAFTSRRDNLGQCIAGICGSGGVYSNAIFLVNADGSNLVRLSLRNDESILWFAWAR